MSEPVPFEVHEGSVYLHGTRAVLAPGAWGSQLALGIGEPRVYVLDPTGENADDPNVTDTRLPGQSQPLFAAET